MPCYYLKEKEEVVEEKPVRKVNLSLDGIRALKFSGKEYLLLLRKVLSQMGIPIFQWVLRVHSNSQPSWPPG